MIARVARYAGADLGFALDLESRRSGNPADARGSRPGPRHVVIGRDHGIAVVVSPDRREHPERVGDGERLHRYAVESGHRGHDAPGADEARGWV